MEAKKTALEALDGLIEQKTGKVKKYLSTFRKRVAADENSLSDRLLSVIKDCETIMKPFLIYELGKGYNAPVDEITPLEDVASKMNTLRNDMAHGDIIILLYHEDMMSVRELLFKNSQKEKTLKRFLEYCYMIDVKVAFEGLKGEKTKGLKAALKFAKEQDMCMTEAQIQGANNT